MHIAILHAPGDEALAAQVRGEAGFADALVAPISSTLSYGGQLVLLVLWTRNAAALEVQVRDLSEAHPSVVVWRRDDAPAPMLAPHIAVLTPESTRASLAPALRLLEIEQARPRGEPVGGRRVRRGLAAGVLGVGIVAALGAAGAAAMMLDGEAPLLVFAGPAETPMTPSPDLRPTTEP